VGHIIDGVPKGWTFDCLGKLAAWTIIRGRDNDDKKLYAGYSIPELEQISQEFWGKGSVDEST
jgi:hypothetical protein